MREIMSLLPSISFAFSFECSVLPVHQASIVKDPSGIRSFRACVRCLIIPQIQIKVIIKYLYYSILMIHSVIYGELILGQKLSNDPIMYQNCEVLQAYKLSTQISVQIISVVSIIALGSKFDLASYILAILLFSCFTIQSIMQLLYTFYETRTHIQILVKELIETSTFVESIKQKEKRALFIHLTTDLDLRQTQEFVEWKQNEIKNEHPSTVGKLTADAYIDDIQNLSEEQKSERKKKQENIDNLTFMLLFSFNIFLACIPVSNLTVQISNIAGSSTVPFLQFALPGFLYYLYLKKCGGFIDGELYNLKKPKAFIKRFIFGRTFSWIFAILGIIQIFVFLTVIKLSQSLYNGFWRLYLLWVLLISDNLPMRKDKRISGMNDT